MSCSSICIPRVFHTTTSQFIKDTFENTFKYGKVERVDMVKKVDKKELVFYKVFVHFKSWSSAEEIRDIRKDLDDGRVIREEFMDYFGNTRWWLFSKSRVAKPEADKEVVSSQAKRETNVSKQQDKYSGVDLKNLLVRLETMEQKYKNLEDKYEETKKRVDELETQVLSYKLSETPAVEEKTTTKRWGDCSSDSESEEESESEDESDNEEEN